MTTIAIRRALGFAAGFLWAAAACANGEFVYPQSGPLTSVYNSPRPYGIHGALDIAGPNLTPITAARGGTVSYAGWMGDYGNLVILSHENGYSTYYGHQARITVRRGQRVARGQQLGLEGSTGHSTGPHVHFEIRRNGAKQFIPGSSGQRVVRGNNIPRDYPGLSGSGGYQQAPSNMTARECAPETAVVRNGAGWGAQIIGTIRQNQIYVANSEDGGWRRIFYDARNGWVWDGSLRRRTNGIGRRYDSDTTARDGREGAGVGSINRGEVFIANLRQDGWLRLWYQGRNVWTREGVTTILYFP